jgi:nitroimidazol reductase NimA-like FMN-containing flavoprotein (pyridoxamine 5'-phosphate oxidase superfamily)
MKSNGLVWGQALEDHGYLQGECNHLYASVHFSGKVSFVEKTEERIRALKMMIEKLDHDPEVTTLKHLTEDCMRRTAIGRIDLEYMTGKKSERLT